MAQPLISFIVPVYNAMPYLPACVDSLLAQEGEDVEFILVDDGSQDDSGAILTRYAAQDARVRVITQKNAGVSAARNAALDAAQGEYLLFVDADDLIARRFLTDLRPHMTAEADLLLFSWTSFYKADGSDIYEGGSIAGLRACTAEERRMLITNTLCPTLYIDKTSLNFRYDNGVKCAVFHRSIIRAAGIRFVEGLSHGEDGAFKLEYLRYAPRVMIADDILYFYRSNPASAMNKYRPGILPVIERMIAALREIIRLRYDDDPDLLARLDGTVIRQSELYFTLYLFHPDCPLSEEEKRQRYRELLSVDTIHQAILSCDPAFLRSGSRVVLEAYRDPDANASYQRMKRIFQSVSQSGLKGRLKSLLIHFGLTGKIRMLQRQLRKVWKFRG